MLKIGDWVVSKPILGIKAFEGKGMIVEGNREGRFGVAVFSPKDKEVYIWHLEGRDLQ